MFLSIWNYIRGYVTIEASGFSVERFINMAAHRGVYIWDVHPSGSKISMKMSVKGFKRLKGCTKKTKCKMRIAKKSGLPFLMYKYRKRRVFALGILLFVAALYLLSSFIWVVEISGNERITTNAIISFCEEIGLKPGAFKYTLDTKKMTNEFMEAFEDLSWLAIEVKGTKAKVSVVETIDAPKIIDKTTPCDVVASADGLITDIVVTSGTPLVKPHDVVKKGDVLVSGMLTIMDGEEIKGYRYTHAEAEVFAKVTEEFTLTEDLRYTRKDYTGKAKKRYAVSIVKSKFNIISTGVSYRYYDKIIRTKPLNLGGDFALPVSIETAEYKEYKPVMIERTFDDAKALLAEKLDRMLEIKLEDDFFSISEREVQFEEINGKAVLNAAITVQMRIDEKAEPRAVIPGHDNMGL